MYKELRGKKIDKFLIEEMLDIKSVAEAYFDGTSTEEERERFQKEFGLNLLNVKKKGNLAKLVRESILSSYNDNISDAVIYIYLFILWYRDSVKGLEKNGWLEHIGSLLDFGGVLDLDSINNASSLASREYNIEDPDECINSSLYKFLAMIKTRALETITEDHLEIIDQNIRVTISNCKFLKLIDDSGKPDNRFILQLEYYPVDNSFREVVDTFDSEVSRSSYMDLKGNEYLYFENIKNNKIDFSSVTSLKIIKNGKKRKVYIANKPADQVTLRFLAKRLNTEFHIIYPNRDKIMELCFNLIDSLPQLDNYTIYKFDFKDFFDSVKIIDVYNKYIEHSNLFSHEKALIIKLAQKYERCVQGLPVSNALIEIISREFDERLRAAFSDDGLIFYSRYVDDCILIFNHETERKKLESIIDACRHTVYGDDVVFSKKKTTYQTKLKGNGEFDYLGYLFRRCLWNQEKKDEQIKSRGLQPNQQQIKPFYYFEFGIAQKKIEKHKQQLDAIFDAYLINDDERLLLRRIQYYNSRIVFCNYAGSKYRNKCTWDVSGVISTYRMLRNYVISDDKYRAEVNSKKIKPYRISVETYRFLKFYIRDKRNLLKSVPAYLSGKGCLNHSLWNGYLNNKSIVFQPNIGWSSSFLSTRLRELGVNPAKKSYYEKTRDYYSLLIKKL